MLDSEIGGVGRQALSVQSVPGERSGMTVACLERLVAEHGAPLVLKAGNGRAFTSKAVSKVYRSTRSP